MNDFDDLMPMEFNLEQLLYNYNLPADHEKFQELIKTFIKDVDLIVADVVYGIDMEDVKPNKVKAILLKGKGQKEEIIELNSEHTFKDIYKYFGVNGFDDIDYCTFGQGYTAIWKNEQNDNTCMEITTYVGASFPIFIDSQVIIVYENEEEQSDDVDIDDVKKYFNTDGSFWALMRTHIATNIK